MKKGDLPTRLAFELDHRPVDGSYTAHAGVPLLIEAFRTSGAGMVLDEKVVKRCCALEARAAGNSPATPASPSPPAAACPSRNRKPPEPPRSISPNKGGALP